MNRVTKHIRFVRDSLTTNFITLILVPLTVTVLAELSRRRRSSGDYLAAAGFAAAAISPVMYLVTRPRPVYLVDFACFKAPPHLKASTAKFLNHSRLAGRFDEASMEFQAKILSRSGLGDETYLPEGVHSVPADLSMVNARAEAESVVFGAVDALLAGNPDVVAARDVGIVVVNCSLFAPTPSLSAAIVNRYRLRSDVRTFNLGGMGCSAGVIAVDLAKDLLRVCRRKTLALVVSTENITQNWYFGNDKSMLLPNCLFRVGGAALLLSSSSRNHRRAKYKLLHAVRTHRGGSDEDTSAFSCVVQRQDASGETGVSLSKDLMSVAARALRRNISELGPLVLPVSEQLRYAASRVFKLRPYVPEFGRAFGHFCIHAGGRAVIEELERSLRLSPDQTEASRVTLHRFGNTSSSSIWYELAYVEAKRRVKRGDRVWQIAFGSGFKCNSAVWEAIRDVEPSSGNPWDDCIRDYPLTVVHR